MLGDLPFFKIIFEDDIIYFLSYEQRKPDKPFIHSFNQSIIPILVSTTLNLLKYKQR